MIDFLILLALLAMFLVPILVIDHYADHEE